MFVRTLLSALMGLSGSYCLAADAGRAEAGIDPYFLDSAPKSKVEPYRHNGSDMIIETRGDSIHIRYEKPRDGLAAVGARPGTLLFAGRRVGDTVEGTALLFKKDCPRAPYNVR